MIWIGRNRDLYKVQLQGKKFSLKKKKLGILHFWFFGFGKQNRNFQEFSNMCLVNYSNYVGMYKSFSEFLYTQYLHYCVNFNI